MKDLNGEALTKHSSLGEIEAVAAEATPGPWEVDSTISSGASVRVRADAAKYSDGYRRIAYCATGNIKQASQRIKDATFIARSRTWVPQLVLELREAREELNELRRLLGIQ